MLSRAGAHWVMSCSFCSIFLRGAGDDALAVAAYVDDVPDDGLQIDLAVYVGHEQVVVGLAQAVFHGAVAALEVVVRLAVLGGVEVEVDAVFLNGLPGEVTLHFLHEGGRHAPVRGDEGEHVAEDARRGTAFVEDGRSRLYGAVIRVVGLVGIAVFEDDQAHVLFVADVHGGLRADVDAAKGPLPAQGAQAALDLHLHFFAGALAGAIPRRSCAAWGACRTRNGRWRGCCTGRPAKFAGR